MPSPWQGEVPTGETAPLTDIMRYKAGRSPQAGRDLVDIDDVSASVNYIGPMKYNSGTKTLEQDLGTKNDADNRRLRDGLLTLTDKTQFADFPVTGQELTDWQTYRQALRDLTDDVNWPEPTFPTPPSTPTIVGVND